MASYWAARPERTVVSDVCCAWLTRAWADCTSLVIEVRPLLAAWIVLMPVDIESSRLLKSLARFDRPWAVKKLIGLSRAELSRLPVARRVCVWVTMSDVCCNCSKFDRTPAVRTILDMVHLSGPNSRHGTTRGDPHWIGGCNRT